MNQVLLLLDNEQERRQLATWLAKDYIVLPLEQAFEHDFDICIADAPSLKRFREMIERRKGPVLVVGEIEDMTLIDEMISVPVKELELQLRLKALLKLHQLSQMARQQQEKLLRISAAFENISDAIIITDARGDLIYHNRAFCKVYEFSAEELAVQGILGTLFRENTNLGRTILDEVKQGQPWNANMELVAKQRGLVPTWVRVDRVLDDTGECIGITFVCRDITVYIQTETAEREQRALSEALRDTATMLTSTLNTDEVFERILTNVGRVVPHDAANIMLIEHGVARIVRYRGYQETGADLGGFAVIETPQLLQMMQTHEPLIIPDTSAYTGWKIDQVCSYVGVPISLKQQTLGFINLGSHTKHFFMPVHADRLRAFAEQAAIAIQNARLYERAQALAAVEERQRLARDLHDAVSQTLFSASVMAESLPRQLNHTSPEKLYQRLKQLHQLIYSALAETRVLLMELRPTSMHQARLADLLSQLTEAIKTRKQININLKLDLLADLPPPVKIAFYRITQEALNNIVKHARATQAEITVQQEPGGVQLSIEDNGRGFRPDEISSTSLGLGIMQERAESIGAALQVITDQGRGTQIIVTWKQ